MLCQNCGSNEANVRYTQIVNGIKKEVSLCDKCSKQFGLGGLDFSMPINFNSFLGGFLDEYDNTDLLTNLVAPKQLKCGKCNMTYEEFINTGKLGCAECYTVFKGKLDSVLKKLHGSNLHTGKKLDNMNKKSMSMDSIVNTQDCHCCEGKPDDTKGDLLTLKTKIKQCIKEEKYEEAAKIRDMIKKIEEGGNVNE